MANPTQHDRTKTIALVLLFGCIRCGRRLSTGDDRDVQTLASRMPVMIDTDRRGRVIGAVCGQCAGKDAAHV